MGPLFSPDITQLWWHVASSLGLQAISPSARTARPAGDQKMQQKTSPLQWQLDKESAGLSDSDSESLFTEQSRDLTVDWDETSYEFLHRQLVEWVSKKWIFLITSGTDNKSCVSFEGNLHWWQVSFSSGAGKLQTCDYSNKMISANGI